MIFFVVYNKTTGDILYRAADPLGAAGQVANLPDSHAAIDVPVEAIGDDGIDLEPIRTVLVVQCDTQAEQARMVFLTPGTGQALTYDYKADEAKRWTADNSVDTPFLTAEAGARGMSVADLAAEVLGAIASWTRIGAVIEAARMKAKLDLAAANNLPTLARAAALLGETLATILTPSSPAAEPDPEVSEQPEQAPEQPAQPE